MQKAKADLKDAQMAAQGAYASVGLSGTTTRPVCNRPVAPSRRQSPAWKQRSSVTTAQAAVETAHAQVEQARRAIAVSRSNPPVPKPR